ncbi:unnamed protein product [Ambrosiozyma monospora]|uniref:Unnamed protein product n=1 Tax=Ambrosiozyma monospora TaxID=43982 RepID=A0ACB5UCS8_AMBMO|nr:unnamed protein product [Ambrosiozyma monospora]
MPPPQFNKVNKINVNGVPASIKSHHSSNKSNGSASSFSFPRSRPTSPPPSSSSATTSASLHKHTRTSSSTVKTATTSKSPSTKSSNDSSSLLIAAAKKKKKPPAVPPKKPHLKNNSLKSALKFGSNGRIPSDASVSTVSTLMTEELDELTADFNKRFPSKV